MKQDSIQETRVAAAVRKFIPSPQQQAFFDWIVNGEGSLVLEAVAGSGKTTTLIEGLTLMKGFVFFGAYNKKIADEIQSRAPQKLGLNISTFHAAGFQAWKKVARFPKVERNKLQDIFRSSQAFPEYKQLEGAVISLASFAKQAAVGITSSMSDSSVWMGLINHFDIDCLNEERTVMSLAKKLLERSIALNYEIIDFDDMIYAPLYHQAKLGQYDWVLIDEAQDTNASRRLLALGMLKPGGRLVAVGDRHQAIYGFTGADSDALDLIAADTQAKRLPLSVTYRCPKAVVQFARNYVSHITAHESAPEGLVTTSDARLTTLVKPGDAIICRLTMPLIRACYQFIAEGIPAKVEGREIGNGLKKLAKRWKVKSFSQLTEKLEKYRDAEIEKLKAKEQDNKASIVEDTVNCLFVLIDRCLKLNTQGDPVQLLIAEIDKIFSDDIGSESVRLMTIHKSKGLEWNVVCWLQTGPSRWARLPWELEQENNLCYVVSTRAKQHLILTQASK